MTPQVFRRRWKCFCCRCRRGHWPAEDHSCGCRKTTRIVKMLPSWKMGDRIQMGFWLLEDVGILQYILDFLLYHDPIIEPYNRRKCVGHGELVFAYERETYRAVKWHPRNHFGRCPNRSCGCCKARMWRIDESCPECYTALILKSASHLLKRATRVNAWRTTTCRCGECQDSWIKAGWICPIRWGNEWMDAVEMNAWWELPVSLAIAHKTTST